MYRMCVEIICFMFYTYIMKNTNTLNDSCVETRNWSTFGKVLPTAAAILALLFAWKWSATEMWASGMNIVAQDSKVTELTDSVISSPDTTEVIDLFPGMKVDWTSSEDVVKSTTNELGDTLITQNSDNGSRIKVNGWIILGTGVLWDFGDKVSDNITPIAYLNINHPKTWAWLRIIRVDDFSNDSDHPFSKVTEVNPYITKTFWKNWEWSVTGEFKYDFVDKSPESNGCAADAVLSYKSESWWSFDWTYTHRFTWKGSDALRLWVSKDIADDFNLGAQVWVVDTNHDWVYYRVSWTKDLWKWFSLQGW